MSPLPFCAFWSVSVRARYKVKFPLFLDSTFFHDYTRFPTCLPILTMNPTRILVSKAAPPPPSKQNPPATPKGTSKALLQPKACCPKTQTGEGVHGCSTKCAWNDAN